MELFMQWAENTCKMELCMYRLMMVLKRIIDNNIICYEHDFLL